MSRPVRGETDPGLGKARLKRWWVSGQHVRSIERAAAFVDDVGFALLFPAPRPVAPSLWEAVAGEDAEPFATGMGADEQKVWTWKDELPRRSLAWYGQFLSGRASLLSPAMLRTLYAGKGEVDDHEALSLSPIGHEIAQALSAQPLPSSAIRALIGNRNRYQRAIVELQRHLLVTTAGVRENRTGWPSALLDLTCRRFDVGAGYDLDVAVVRFLDTMVETSPADLARAFGWSVTRARAHLDGLVATSLAESDGSRYVAAG